MRARGVPAPDGPADLVGTVRMGTWRRWVAEAEDPEFWAVGGAVWYSRHALARRAARGSRFYVVSEGRLRLYVTLSGHGLRQPERWIPLIVAPAPAGETGIVPVTLDSDIRGFRGLRRRWWGCAAERPCPDWKGAALGLDEGER